MGKSKPRVRAKDRADPFSKPTKAPADPELAALREQRILPVLQDLQSPDLNKRSAAARAITNIIEDTKIRKLLLREKIVKILFDQTLTDSNLETRTDGWGILQNLALEEEADFSVHLYRQDILTTISGVITTIMQTLGSKEVPISKLPKAQQQLVWKLSMSIISLLSSLCETQEEVVEAVSKMPTLLDFLFGVLTFELSPAELRHEVLSCMMALTEDNKPVAQQIVESSDEFGYLIKLKDSDADESVVACGILHNIFAAMQWFDHNTPLEGTSDAILIPVLTASLDRVQSANNGTNGTDGHAQNSSPEQVLQLALDIMASIATGLQEAIEHGSRNEKEFEGFGDDPVAEGDEMDAEDEDMGQEGGEEEEDDDEMTQDEIDADMALVLGDGPSDDEEGQSDEVTLDNLIRLATPRIIALSQRALLASDDNSAKSHALAALNNIAWTVSSIDFSTGHIEKIRRSWISSAQTIWDDIICTVLASNTADVELASAITSLAWAVSKSVKGKVQIRNDEHRKFMALYQASKGMSLGEQTKEAKTDDELDAFQGLGVKCIGVLGSLALDPAPIDLNREIGVFLITILSGLPDVPPADAVEALNQLFDIYADKYAFDEPVFWGNNFSKHLEGLQPKARKMAKSIDMRKHQELRARADEAVLNLGRFLVYKRKERKNKSTD